MAQTGKLFPNRMQAATKAGGYFIPRHSSLIHHLETGFLWGGPVRFGHSSTPAAAAMTVMATDPRM